MDQNGKDRSNGNMSKVYPGTGRGNSDERSEIEVRQGKVRGKATEPNDDR